MIVVSGENVVVSEETTEDLFAFSDEQASDGLGRIREKFLEPAYRKALADGDVEEMTRLISMHGYIDRARDRLERRG